MTRFMTFRKYTSDIELLAKYNFKLLASRVDQELVNVCPDLYKDGTSDLKANSRPVQHILNSYFRLPFSVVTLFRPKHLKNKFEDSTLNYEGDATLYKMKNWVTDNV